MNTRPKVMFCCYGENDLSGPSSWLKRILPQLQQDFEVVVLMLQKSSEVCRTSACLQELGIPVRQLIMEDLLPEESILSVLEVIQEETPTVVVADHVEQVFMANYWLRPTGVQMVQVARSDDWWHWRIAREFAWGAEACRVAAVVTVSRELEAKHKARMPADQGLLYCPSSVPLPETQAKWREDRFHAIYLGRFESGQKRILELTRQLIAVSRDRPNFSATLYGDGPDLTKVEELLAGQNQVSYGGVLPQTEVYPRLQKAQALVLFSAYEGLSTAVQEAMACGVPVIMRQVASGMDGVLRHAETGLVLEADEQLGGAVDMLAGAREFWCRLSRGARSVAEKEFSIVVAAECWHRLLQGLISGRPQKALPLPELLDVERVHTCHIAQRDDLNLYQLQRIIKHRALESGRITELLDEYFHRPEPDWEMRRQLLYSALEYGILDGKKAAHFAAVLIENWPGLEKTNAALCYKVASLAEVAGMYPLARENFSALLADKESETYHAGCLYHLGTVAMAEGDGQVAAEYLRACLALNKKHRKALKVLNELLGNC